MAKGTPDWWSRTQAVMAMNFVDLQDTPGNYVGNDTEVPIVDEVNDQLIFGHPIPANHAGRHENGGVDEINVAGLSGELADNQKSTFLKLSDTPGAFAGHALEALRVNAGANAVEFAAFPTGEWEYVDERNPANAANFDFAGLTAGKRYMLMYQLIPIADGAILNLIFNNDGGNTYGYGVHYFSMGGAHAGGASIPFTRIRVDGGLGNDNGYYGMGHIIFLCDPNDLHYVWAYWSGMVRSGPGVNYTINGAGVYWGTANVTRVTGYFDATNMTGKVILYVCPDW